MSTLPNTISVTELRRKIGDVFSRVEEEKLFLVLQNSVPKAALIEIEYLKMLQEAYEDYLDILEFDKRIKEKRIPLERHKRMRAKKVTSRK